MSIGAAFCIFGGVYYWLGKMSGRQYPELWGKIQFWLIFLGVNITFFPQHFSGLAGMPRRYPDFPEAFAGWNYVSSLGAFLSGFAFLMFFAIVFWTLAFGRRCEANPWGAGADTLEWTFPSPPPAHTHEVLPRIA